MALALAIPHILANLQRHILEHPSRRPPPLFVAVQGPQGSGKTYLANHLRQRLSAPPNNLSVAVLSIDDLYLPHSGLEDVAARHPHNRLLQGRGLPGTHDIALGTHLLEQLTRVNDEEASTTSLEIPSFEKSLYGGKGDRLPEGTLVGSPIDVVIFEGWFVGFAPIIREDLDRKYGEEIPDLDGLLDIRSYSIEKIAEVNEKLKGYVAWWKFFDTIIQIKPPSAHPYSFIYSWRLQQEQWMKAVNGGNGMTDEQVKRFVDRYIPGYVFFADGVDQGHRSSNGELLPPTWKGNGLRIIIDENRAVLDAETF